MSWSHNRAAPEHGPGETRHCAGAWSGRRTGSGPSGPGRPSFALHPRACVRKCTQFPGKGAGAVPLVDGRTPLSCSDAVSSARCHSSPGGNWVHSCTGVGRTRPQSPPEGTGKRISHGPRLSALSSRRIVGRPGVAGRRSPVRSECPPATRPASSLDGGQPQRHRTVGSPNVTGRAGMTVSLGRVFAGRVLGLNAGRVASKSVIACSSRRVRPMSSSPSMRRQRV